MHHSCCKSIFNRCWPSTTPAENKLIGHGERQFRLIIRSLPENNPGRRRYLVAKNSRDKSPSKRGSGIRGANKSGTTTTLSIEVYPANEGKLFTLTPIRPESFVLCVLKRGREGGHKTYFKWAGLNALWDVITICESESIPGTSLSLSLDCSSLNITGVNCFNNV